MLDSPTGDRIQRRRTQRLASAKAETCVVPRATDGVAGHETFGERTVIVRAMRTDREESVAATEEDRIFGIDAPTQHAAVPEIVNGDPLREIGSASGFFVGHDFLVAALRRDVRTLHQMYRRRQGSVTGKPLAFAWSEV